MGLILDSSVLIAAERQGKNARQMLTAIAGKIGETDVGISVVTLVELAHDGENQARGIRIPLSDMIIGVTALELGYSIGTANLRHFRQVLGLSVVQL